MSINPEDIEKEGYLFKESKWIKDWRKRWFVLSKNWLMSFKDEKIYSKPTEAINMRLC